jgi:peptidoglycan hydrolase CwlO-like protein
MKKKHLKFKSLVFVTFISIFALPVIAQNPSYDALHNQIIHLNNKLDYQSRQINDLNNKLDYQSRQINDLRAQIDYQHALIKAYIDKTMQIERYLRDLRNFTTPRPIIR